MRRSNLLILFALPLAMILQLIPVSSFIPLRDRRSSIALAQDEEPLYVPGQLIIRFKEGTSREEIANFYAEFGLTERDNLDGPTESSPDALRLAAIPVDVNDELIEVLENDERVVYVEPNYLLSISQTPDDPQFKELWGLDNTGQTGGTPGADISALASWNVTKGSRDIVVGVIDTGVDYTHEDLIDNMWVNAKECPKGIGKCEANGKDEDNNGYADDFYGINAITDSGDPMDDFGHGTHVAGTIGAVGNNKTGIVGVNQKVRIVACKFLSASGGGSVAGAVKCFNYISHLKNKQKVNLVVVNNSWGGASASQALKDAMSGPDQPLHICAAGNANSSRISYPAGFDLENIVSVAATDHDDNYASFSNYGADWVDLAAPGVDILSTVPTGRCALCNPTGYRTANGTSMATPHVTGAIALVKAQYKDLSAMQIVQRVISGVDPLTDHSKETATNGRLNLLNSLEDDDTPPAAVADLAISGVLMSKVQLRWTATGDDDHDGTANQYDIRYARAPITDATWESANVAENVPPPQATGSAEEFTFAGLDPDTTYYFALKVLDNVGNASTLSNVVVGSTSAGTIVFEDAMENGPGDWVAEGTDDLWHISSKRFNSPSHAWYYGDEKSGNYDTGDANSGTLTSPPINLVDADDAMLTFYEWSQLQSSSRFDLTRVQISSDGVRWQTAFQSHGTADAWVKRVVNISEFVEPTSTVYLRFWFDTVSSSFNEFEGWYIDDVQLLTAKLELPGNKTPTANLVVQESNIGFSPADPVVGQTVTINTTILNDGTAEANDVIVQFVDVTGGGSLPIGQPQTIANLPVGGSGTAHVEYRVGRAPVGREKSSSDKENADQRQIKVIADPNNFIAEQNESDNDAVRTLTVMPKPAPNLVMLTTNIGFDPPAPSLGDQVTVRATILNDGNLRAEDVMVQFVDTTGTGSTPIGAPQLIDAIEAGGSGVAEITYDTSGAAADRTIAVVLDPSNAIDELDEDDNDAEAKLELTIPSAPNLMVEATNIGFNPATPTAGDDVLIQATILNNGTADAVDILVQFVDATNSAATPIGQQQSIDLIPAGGSAVAQVLYNTSGRSGDRKIEVIADPHNFIPELKETDNDAKSTLTIAPLAAPNLVIQGGNIGFSNSNPVEGDRVTINATILNQGTADADDVMVQFVDVTDGHSLPIGERQTIGVITAGSSGSAQVAYDTTELVGTRQLQVIVDPSNFVRELDETDNEEKATLKVAAAPAPNLVMLANNIKFNPPRPVEGESVDISAIVLNTGTAPAEKVLVQFIDMSSGVATPIGAEITIDEIPVGGSRSVHATYDTGSGTVNGRVSSSGNRKIQLLVDSNNLIAETSDSDNEAIKTLAVQPSPQANLVMLEENIGFNPARATEGDLVVVDATILNRGNADAGTIVVQFVNVSSGRPIPIGQPQLINSIAIGGSETVQVTFDSTGITTDQKIRVVIDPTNFVSESDETDNKATQTLAIAATAAPNLSILPSNIGFNPPHPVQGKPVTVTATIVNDGLTDAQEILIQFVDVTDGTMIPIGAKQTIPSIAAGESASVQVTYQTSGKEGERKIQVLVDPHTVIAEADERDNAATQLLTIVPPAAPNLLMQSGNIGFGITSSAQGTAAGVATIGESVTLHATVLNTGNADAEDVAVQFVDVTDGASTPIGASQLIGSIAAGDSGSAQILYDTALFGAPGDRKIQVIADRNNSIIESNENDNEAKATLMVAAPAAPNLLMDADNIGFDPLQANPGDQVTIYATVLNVGSADANDVVVQFVDSTKSATPIGQPQTIETIPAGGSGSVQISYDTSQFPNGNGVKIDDRKVQIIVDPNNFIAESKETDNDAQKTLTMIQPAAPDLVASASNIGFNPPAPRQGDRVTVSAVVRNAGTLAASDVVVQFMVKSDEGTRSIGTPQTIDNIPVGGSGQAQVTFAPDGAAGGGPAEREIQIVVDPSNFVAESKETNNRAKKKLTVAPSPAANLVMRANNIGFNPRVPIEGDLLTISAVVLNDGTVDVTDVAVQFIDVTDGNATPIGTPQLIGAIAAGSSGVAQASLDTTGLSGERRIQIVVDPNNFILEADEGDNRAAGSLPIEPPPAPNLMIIAGNLKFDPVEPQQGEVVTLTATILNDGSEDASDVLVQFVETTDGASTPIGTEQVIDELPAGSSGTVQVFYADTDEAGERTIQVTVDPTDAIEESNESDNRAIKTLTISAPKIPNLVMRGSNIAFAPLDPIEGDSVAITVTVENKGNTAANDVVVQVVDVTDGGSEPVDDAQTIETIDAEESAEIVVTYETAGKAGSRKIEVTVDPENAIVETNEEDNSASKTIKVRSEDEEPPDQPNLVMKASQIVFDPTAPEPGDLVTVTITVTNAGKAAAEDVLVRIEDATDEEPVLIAEKQITGTLDAESSAVITVPYDTTDKEGDRKIQVTVDPENAIPEEKETDNQASKTLKFGSGDQGSDQGDGEEEQSQANLHINPADIKVIRSEDGTSGGENRRDVVTVAATIRNSGAVAAQDVMVQFVDVTDGTPQPIGGTQLIPTLAANGNSTVQVDLSLTASADREIQVVVDPYNIVPEGNEVDNVANKTASVAAPSDANLIQPAVED